MRLQALTRRYEASSLDTAVYSRVIEVMLDLSLESLQLLGLRTNSRREGREKLPLVGPVPHPPHEGGRKAGEEVHVGPFRLLNGACLLVHLEINIVNEASMQNLGTSSTKQACQNIVNEASMQHLASSLFQPETARYCVSFRSMFFCILVSYFGIIYHLFLRQ